MSLNLSKTFGLIRPMTRSLLLSTSTLTRFAVNGVEAALALDFIGSEYRTANTSTTFADAFLGNSPRLTYNPGSASTSQSTMTQGYGPELVENGGFDTDSGWTKGTGWTISGGVASFSGGGLSGNNLIVYQDNNVITTGSTYEVTYTVSGRTAGTVAVFLRGSSPAVYHSTNDTFTRYITAGSSSRDIEILANDTFDGSIDNISVREAPKIVWAPHNLLEYSEDFSQWYDVDGTLDTTLHEAPDGSTTARKITVNTASTAYTREFLTIGASSHTFGVYVKAGTASTVQLYVIQQGSTSGTADIDLATGQVSNVSSAWTVAPVATSVGDGWWLVVGSRSFTAAASNHGVGVTATNQNGLTYYIWGAHLYRSDLGGMAPVPGAVGDFQYYVPTNGAAEYLPRVGHHVFNGSTWVNEGLLIESEVRTNLVTHSEDFSHASWTATKLEVGALVAGPDGASNVATTLTATDPSSSYTHKIDVRNVAPDPQTGTNTASIFVKQGTNRYVALTQEWSSNFTYAVYDLEGGVVTETGSGGTGSYVSSTMEPSGNGFWRISLSGSIGTSGSDAFVLLMSHTGTPNRRDPAFTASGTETIYVYGAQLEDAPTPSSYIPTSGSTVTRGGQSLTVPPAEFGWPEPEYIGPELVTNGGFDTDTVWTKGPGWTISGGVASCSGSSSSLVQNFTSVSGAVYAVSFDVSSYTSGTINTTVGGNYTAQQTVTNPTVGQTYNIVVVGGTNTTRGVEFYGGSFNGSIDNISVREINPLSVSFQMDGRMTYADESDFRQVSFGRWSQASTNELELRLNTGSTAVGKLQPLHDDNNEIAPLSVSDVYNPGSLVPFNVAARFGSNFLNAAADGSTMTALTTPTALPDLSNTDLQIAQDFMGTIGTFRQFAGDIGDAGLVTATNPSTEPTLSLTFDGTGGSFYNLNWSE